MTNHPTQTDEPRKAQTTRDGVGEWFAVDRATDQDFPLIADSFFKTIRQNSTLALHVSDRVLQNRLRPLISWLLLVAGAWVAYVRGDREEVLGWLVAEPERNLVHLAYTKLHFRRHGVMKALLKAAGLDTSRQVAATFPTRDLALFMKNDPLARVGLDPFDPWIRYGQDRQEEQAAHGSDPGEA